MPPGTRLFAHRVSPTSWTGCFFCPRFHLGAPGCLLSRCPLNHPKTGLLRDLTLRLVQGGGIQKKFAELMLPELQDDHDPPLDIDNVTEEIVRILSVIKTTHFDNLPLGRCGCLQADQEPQCFINFCKGQ